ncbi:MAG: uroporphyrinogen decarboxylase family protein [Planctomycetota bacterium]|jgi:hypothetical protein
MNSKERMYAAINHEEADRVPIGEWQYGEEVMTPVLGHEPLFHNGLKTQQLYWEGRGKEVVADWKEGLVKITKAYNWDSVLVHLLGDENTKIDVPEKIDEKTWKYENGAVIQYSAETNRLLTIEGGTPPTDIDQEEINRIEPTDSQLEIVRHVVKELGDTHFIFCAPLAGPGRRMRAPSGKQVNEVEAWCELFTEPEKWVERKSRWVNSEHMAKGIEIAKREGIDAIAYSCDYGGSTGPFISPEIFKDHIQPILAKYVELVHARGLKFLHHACGNNQVLMDMIVEAGVDVYQSIQTEMDIVKMKKRYGKEITLWGGVPAGDLILSTPEKVKETGKYYLNECKTGGGFIYGTSHSIMPGTKYENYQAMLDAHSENGSYEKVSA